MGIMQFIVYPLQIVLKTPIAGAQTSIMLGKMSAPLFMAWVLFFAPRFY